VSNDATAADIAAPCPPVLLTIAIPEPSLVVLVGPTGAGKSTFAARHFRPTEVVSSDACRAMVADDPDALDVNSEAFAVLHAIAGARLALGRLTVVDATRTDRRLPPHVVRRHILSLRHSLRTLEHEGFHDVHVLHTPEDVDAVEIERQPLSTDSVTSLGMS
jgi:protein phosphatase